MTFSERPHDAALSRTLQIACKRGKNPAPLAAADKWLRYFERFWSERLDVLETLLRADDAAAAKRKKKASRHER